MTEPETLAPPKRRGTMDPGAHDLESSESEDHFSDAPSAPMSPSPSSPIPRTRVEKVDNEPSYGEVPGTEAYRKREGDAEPDEIAIVPDPVSPFEKLPPTSIPGPPPESSSTDAPQTVVTESAGATGPHSQEFKEKLEKEHQADAAPDVVVKPGDGEGAENTKAGSVMSPVPGSGASATAVDESAMSVSSNTKSPTPSLSSDSDRLPPSELDRPPESPSPDEQIGNRENNDDQEEEEEEEDQEKEQGEGGEEADEEGDEEDEPEDDFDDFEEGDDDADFDDFEDGFQEAEPTPIATPNPPAPVPQPTVALPFAVPDFEELDADEIEDALNPYVNALFPPEDCEAPRLPPPQKDQPIFLTERSASLWSQLVAPPPLSPPDWIRSRIRRLFLVSLGVPVDLDEILPASKQKKLVLPSLSLHPGSSASPRTSSDSRSRSVTRLKQAGQNTSSTSVDTQGKAGTPSSSKPRRKGPPPEPELDLVSAKQLCMTTDEALGGMTDEELTAHVRKLASLEEQAKEALVYWQKRTDEKISDRETFEGVIENLVKHARKVRK